MAPAIPFPMCLLAGCFQETAQSAKAPLNESITSRVVGGSSCLMNAKELAYLSHHLRSKVCPLLAVQLSKSFIPGHYLIHQFSPEGGSLMVSDWETFQPLWEITTYHQAKLNSNQGSLGMNGPHPLLVFPS